MIKNLWFLMLLGLFAGLAPASAKASASHFSSHSLGNPTSQNDRHQLGQAVCLLEQSLPVNLQEVLSQPFKKQHANKPGSNDFKMGVALLYLDYEYTIIPGLPSLTLMYPYHSFP